ncbi:MAG: PilZ domain-containing protein [Candidatus Omnitrophica bacterium]|nr:PilZ domain-containing protein [Candidatus Omnitrophota bacterium]MCF7895099.1 PilZ domain-containing protein [Candidatus Omnitrophota bacterium]
MESKRKYFRYQLAFPVEYQQMSLLRYSHTVTKDLSLGGVKIISDGFVPKGSTLKLKLNLIKRVFNFKTRIAWCNRERFSDRYYLGCEFIELPYFYKNQYRDFLNAITDN